MRNCWPNREHWERGDRFNGAGVGGYFMGGFSSPIKSVQYGSITFAAGDTTKDSAALTAFVVANSVVMYLGVRSDDASILDNCNVSIVIKNTTTITGNRNAAAGVNTTVNFVVVEFASGVLKSNQDKTISISPASNTNTGTITAVDVTKTVLIFRGQISNSAANDFGRNLATFTLTNTTTITVTRNSTSDTVSAGVTALEFN